VSWLLGGGRGCGGWVRIWQKTCKVGKVWTGQNTIELGTVLLLLGRSLQDGLIEWKEDRDETG